MTDQSPTLPSETIPPRESLFIRFAGALGGRFIAFLEHMGAMLNLLLQAVGFVVRAGATGKGRVGRQAIIAQIVRVGVRSVAIVSLVSGCIGFILAFQLAPPLADFGQKELVANIVSIAVLRELGPLIAAVVMTGFAGASIAAEIGTMVVSEEVEALESMALNPVRFLVVPRVFATIMSLTVLAVIADLVAVGSACTVSVTVLEIPFAAYKQNTLDQAKLVDFLTGVGKGAVFGMLVGIIACANGLKVTGGAAGVGRATTGTVVQSVVGVVVADLIFTAIFYALNLF